MYSHNIVKMDEKGKISIPPSIRKKYGWNSGLEFEILELDGCVSIIPIIDLDELPKIPLSQYSKIYNESREEELDIEK